MNIVEQAISDAKLTFAVKMLVKDALKAQAKAVYIRISKFDISVQSIQLREPFPTMLNNSQWNLKWKSNKTLPSNMNIPNEIIVRIFNVSRHGSF